MKDINIVDAITGSRWHDGKQRENVSLFDYVYIHFDIIFHQEKLLQTKSHTPNAASLHFSGGFFGLNFELVPAWYNAHYHHLITNKMNENAMFVLILQHTHIHKKMMPATRNRQIGAASHYHQE